MKKNGHMTNKFLINLENNEENYWKFVNFAKLELLHYIKNFLGPIPENRGKTIKRIHSYLKTDRLGKINYKNGHPTFERVIGYISFSMGNFYDLDYIYDVELYNETIDNWIDNNCVTFESKNGYYKMIKSETL